jgi:hypothetical protein
LGEEYFSRAYVVPVQPGTGQQRARWNKFKGGVVKWQNFSQAIKDQYNIEAKPLKISGFNLCMREHMT